jgi:hypothetical protein
MIEYLIAFFGVMITDFFYVHFVKAIGQDSALKGGLCSGAYYLISAIIIINYTANHALIIPVALGAFVGSYIGIKYKGWK